MSTDIEEGITEQYTDCLGRTRTPEEIKERDKFRSLSIKIGLCGIYLVLFLTCIVVMVVYSPNPSSPLFISFAVFLGILTFPVVIGVLCILVVLMYLCIESLI